MEEDYISISTLNDFIFCPYSIYLHNVYMGSDEGLYHATPQTRGRNAHEAVDTKKASNRAIDLQSLPILSEKYKLMGKIDLYRGKEKKLIERKFLLKNIYQGQIYQLWAQLIVINASIVSIAVCVIKPSMRMFTNKDIEFRSVYVVNCLTDRELRVSSGELLLEDMENHQTLTKLPFQKILALFIVGHIHVTTPLIEKCKKHNVALVVMKPSLRPVFYWADAAEANFLVRKKQYEFLKDDISIARILVGNKIANQKLLLKKNRKRDELTMSAIDKCKLFREQALHSLEYNVLMGIEGLAAKLFFEAYFQDLEWKGRRPRIKGDYINSILDIGYIYLFNFMECFVRMFGFDIYVGVYHRLWFKRKSLICDLMEPFRCIIDRTVRTAINRMQLKESDFSLYKGEYKLKPEKNKDYSIVFFNALVPYKNDIFKYVQQYYRCFMNNREPKQYPQFTI